MKSYKKPFEIFVVIVLSVVAQYAIVVFFGGFVEWEFKKFLDISEWEDFSRLLYLCYQVITIIVSIVIYSKLRRIKHEN